MKMCGFIDPSVSITSTFTIENITHTTYMKRFLYPMRDNHSHALQQTISHTKGICMYCRFWKVYNIPVSLLHTPNILIVSLFAYSDRAEYISAWIPYFAQHIPIRPPKFVILLIFAILYSFRTRYQSCSTTNPSYTHFTSLVLVLRLTPLRILESAPFSLHTHYNAITRISFFSNHYNHYRQSEQALGKKLSPMMRIWKGDWIEETNGYAFLTISWFIRSWIKQYECE